MQFTIDNAPSRDEPRRKRGTAEFKGRRPFACGPFSFRPRRSRVGGFRL